MSPTSHRGAATKNRRRWLFASLGGLLVLTAVALFLLLFEPVTREVETGMSGEALHDPFLAARRLLVEMGVPTERIVHLTELPPAGHLLLMPSALDLLSGTDADRLLAWVEQGGQLLASEDFFLAEKLGVEVIDGLEDETVEAEPDEHAATEAEDDAVAPEVEELVLPEAREVRIASSPGVEHTVLLEAIHRFRLVDDAKPEFTVTLAGERGPVLVRFRRGRGWVTLFVAPNVFDNRSIGEAEHAALLWALSTFDGKPSGARVLASFDRPSLGSLLARHGWMPIVAGLAWLAFWLWRRALRLGPLLADPPRERRSLLEHVQATADYLWRTEDAALLVESSRQGLLKRAAIRFPGFGQLGSRAKVERLAATSGRPADEVAWALGTVASQSRSARGRAELARLIDILETVRRSL